MYGESKTNIHIFSKSCEIISVRATDLRICKLSGFSLYSKTSENIFACNFFVYQVDG